LKAADFNYFLSLYRREICTPSLQATKRRGNPESQTGLARNNGIQVSVTG
jgi:hypothetical protein